MRLSMSATKLENELTPFWVLMSFGVMADLRLKAVATFALSLALRYFSEVPHAEADVSTVSLWMAEGLGPPRREESPLPVVREARGALREMPLPVLMKGVR